MIANKPQQKEAALVLVSLGNTNLAVASWQDDKRSDSTQIGTSDLEQAANTIQETWNSLPKDQPRAIVVSSVVPDKLEQLRNLCAARQLEPILVVGENLPAPIGADLPAPEKVGTDRLCVAAAAFDKVKSACVVADFGTALTVDLIADNGVFLGGTILPGLALSARALHEHTAQLPLVEMHPTDEILGKDTVTAIRNGINAMMAGALREIVERYATDIGRWPPLIVTGGDAKGISEVCDFVDRVAPDLAMDGLVLAYQQFIQQAGKEL